MKVLAWKDIITIPTYPIGEAERNPVFIENRVYQGSSGKVYPHAVVESISDEKINKKWNAVFIENNYLKIMVLPELGGRIQMAFDKIKNRHFIYHNQVIKPALVGLTGPWISGGIEFNWPQHHRPSTYLPIEADIEKNKNGSQTIWCNEVELMFRTKGMMGFTLYPDKAYLEIKVKLYSRTPQPQTFLWWANPAVKVNDHYQSVFPPDVHAVFDHGKRDVSDFPIATGTYYKVDYSPGTDISKYKNIPVPTSYMAVNSEYNFMGGYENDSKAGVLHVANHHVSPGKKQWTWGHSDFGQAWDRNLTDEDGPYIELMCGVFTDNQPDFSWIMPYEERSFEQYFLPYQNVGVVKNASKEAAVNLEFKNKKAFIKVYTTGFYKKMNIRLKANEKIIFNKNINAEPGDCFEDVTLLKKEIPVENYQLIVSDQNGNRLVEYRPESKKQKPLPAPAKAALLPHEIKSIEQLYLRGLHLEQYRHATYDPRPYYSEALKRESGNVRNNNAMGLWMMRNGQFKKAVPYFKKAIETLTEKNPNPYDGEPYFNLGQCLKYQGETKKAYAFFYKATWNAAWQGASFFSLAQIACSNKEFEEALYLIEKALIRNWHNHKARALKAVVLRYLNKNKIAERWGEESLRIDRFNMGVLFEKYFRGNKTTLREINNLMRGYIHNYIEYALDYAAAGLFKEAGFVLKEGLKKSEQYPMAFYFLGHFAFQEKQIEIAKKYFIKAENACADRCFPYRLEAIGALMTAIRINPKSAKAHYYLGDLWYDKKNYDVAINHWESSAKLDNSFPTVFRNLALAYFNKNKNAKAALLALEHAFELDSDDARVLMELDQLYKRLNYPHQLRLGFLENNLKSVLKRDDLYLERATLYNQLGEHEKALSLIMDRKFHPWEGGEGKVTGQYLYSHIELAKKAIKKKKYNLALKHLKATEHYPHNLGEGKLYGAKENDILYWKGMVYLKLKKKKKAKAAWELAAAGQLDLSISMYYNDQPPDKIFYQGLALKRLKKYKAANSIFKKFIKYGKAHKNDKVTLDYFAVSLPDLLIWEGDLELRNHIHCLYLMGLGFVGLDEFKKAKKVFSKILKLDNSHQGATVAMNLCK